MSLSATATIQSDIQFSLVNSSSDTQSESASLSYGRALANGTGALQCNYGVLRSGTLASGSSEYFDMVSLTKEIFNLETSVQFSKIKSIIVENRNTTYGEDFTVVATGSNGFTGIFNGGSGNMLIKPYATFSYSDPISGTDTYAGNSEVSIINQSTTGIDWTLIVVGITG